MLSFFLKNKYQVLLWLLITGYIIYFSVFTVLRYRHLYAEYFDLGIMQQTVFNTYQALKTGDWSRLLELTAPYADAPQIKRMAIHNDILLALIAPFYFLYSGPETLLVLQSVILALGAWAVFKIAGLLIKNNLMSLVLAFAYLMFPPMQRANIFEFHAVTFATTFILFVFYFYLKGKYGLSFIFLILTLLAKEETGLTLGMFGLYLLYNNRLANKKNQASGFSKIFPLAIIIISWGWALFSVFWLTPYFRGSQHFAVSYYGNLTGTWTGLLFNKSTIEYFVNLFGPLVFLPLFSPGFIFITLPEFAINLLSSDTQLRSLYFQYSSVIQPWLFIGGIYGTKKIIDRLNQKYSKYMALTIFITTLVFVYFKGPFPKLPEQNIDPWLYKREGESKIVKTWQKKLAADEIKVSATDQIAPFFTSRRYFYIFSKNYKKANYVILSLANLEFTYRKEVIPAYEELKKDPDFKQIEKENDYVVYKHN